MPRYTLIVATKPVPGKEAEWNRWYDEVHLNEVLRLSGFRSARRLEGLPSVGIDRASLALYEISAVDDADANAALERLQAAPLTETDALDAETVTFDLYRERALSVRWAKETVNDQVPGDRR